jgi:LacI family transcriptional regulator
VSNINQGIGALAATRDAGRRVPRDVSVIAYDDDPISNYLAPPLTAIRMPLHEMGVVAVETVLDRIEGHEAKDVTVPTPPELIVRSSTAPPSGRRT